MSYLVSDLITRVQGPIRDESGGAPNTVPGSWEVVSAGTTAQFYQDYNKGTWSSTGGKYCWGIITYGI